MRWPLRNQILTRMLLLLVITIVSLTYASIHSVITANREAELDRLQRLVELMTNSQFPLTSSVLEDMKLLSGAEFLLAKDNGEVVSKTAGVPSTFPRLGLANGKSNEPAVPAKFETSGKAYYHTAVKGIRDSNRATTTGILHILVPSQTEQSIWWQASKSPLKIALFVLPLALLFSLALASHVTRPLAKLNTQVQQIADGRVQQIPVVQRNDEIRDLNVSINEMSVKLQDHDVQLQKNVRLRTMVQFGSGVAHHLRNSATGCKMAVELLAVERQGIANSDNYQVAIRQLGLMDNYIKRFLLLSKSPESSAPDSNFLEDVGFAGLGDVLKNVVFLLRPSAEHLGVDLSIQSKCDGSRIRMTEDDAQQLMMNLISNAIRAASERGVSGMPDERGLVSVTLLVNDGNIDFTVTDNGLGPPEDIAESIFDPFITGSREGTGLGLSLVREISNRANGVVRWRRDNGLTIFSFEAEKQNEAEAG